MKLSPPTLSLAATTLSLSLATAPASAALLSFPLTFSFIGGDYPLSSGTGEFIVDDNDLGPNVVLGDSNNLDGLQGFSATFTDLDSVPSTTTFALTDLSSWILTTDSNANITDVNFFMFGSENADGYTLLGQSRLIIELFRNGQDAAYQISVGNLKG